MSNPSVVACPAGVWTLVASNVRTGLVIIKEVNVVYYSTYRETGDTAPTVLEDEGVRLRQPGGKILGKNNIDVYIWCQKQAGRVQVQV